MRIERVFLEKITTVQLDIGYVGEHDHCRVIIDSASILAYYPNALASMVAKSPAGVLYPVVLQQDGNDVIWNVSDSDLARAGIGTFQLTFTQNGEIIKTAHGSYKVDPSLLAEGDPPDPIESWIEEANQKLADVTEAVQEATEAAENADSMASEAEEAASDATAAAALANEKAALADQKATLADTAASSANTAAASATSAASSATSAASNATSAASSANTAASTANTAAGKIDNMTVAASSSQTPTATITEVDGHKHILFGLVKGDPGKDFHIAKTFSSIAEMMAYTGTDVDPYDFAMIDTGSVQDPDTGKLYCYEPDKTPKWQYIGDLSGAQGIKGETGTGISSIALNQDYTLTIYLDDGTSYTTTSIRGAKGDTGDPGTPGAPGDPGPAGQNAYVYIRYSTSEPVQDADMHTTPDNWMGIYSGTSSTAPTAYTDYAWYKIKGETGSATNVYGTTVPMSEQDSTKVATAIGNKLDANQGSANAGKFMKVGNDGSLVPDTVPDPTGKADKVTNATSGNFAGLDSNGNLTDSGSKASDFLTQHQDISGKADKVSNAMSGNFAGLDSNGNLTDSGSKASDFLTQHQDITGKADKVSNATSGNFAGLDANGNLTDSGSKASDFLTQHQDISGKVDKNQGVAYAGKALGINNQGMVEPVEFSGTDFTGATGSTAGTHGLVPAPAATDNTKYLKGDGTWADVLPSVTSSDNGKSLEVINGEWTTGNEKIDKHFDVEKFEEKTWGKTFAPGSSYVWTDGENIYYSNSSDQYVLDKSTSTWSFKTWSGLTNFDGSYIWTDGENIYYSYNANQYVLDKSTSTWSRKTWTGLTNFDGKQIWSNGENIYYSSGANQYVLDKSTSTWSAKTWIGLTSFYGYSVWSDGENIYYSNGATQYVLDKSTSTWSRKTWKGSTSFSGNYVWTDGENIYCSNGATQYVLDKSTSTWSSKTWTGLTSFNGSYIWTDGENIYYSYNANQYVLDKSTSTWSTKTWKGSTSFSGYSVWTDGENIYYSSGANQYVLDKSTSTWSAKTWIGLTSFYGYSVWSDGENIYYSNGATQYVLDKSTSTWSSKTWTGLTNFTGNRVWSDGENIYYSNGATQYVLDKSTSTWSSKTWTGLTNFDGSYIWTDGGNIYYSNSSDQYVLDKSTSTWSFKTWSGLTNFDGSYIWTDGENIYYSYNANQYVLDKSTSTWSRKTWTGLTSFNGSYIWTDGKNIYYSNSSGQYKLNNIYNKLLLGRNGTFVPVSISDVVSSPVTMTGADGANAGTAGYVPAPAAGDQDKVLHGDGTWKTALNNKFVQLLAPTAYSNNNDAQLSESIENYDELYIELYINTSNGFRIASSIIPVSVIKNNGYGTSNQYIINAVGTANVTSDKIAYVIFAQIAFKNAQTINMASSGYNGWSGTLYVSIYAK